MTRGVGVRVVACLQGEAVRGVSPVSVLATPIPQWGPVAAGGDWGHSAFGSVAFSFIPRAGDLE